MAEPKPYAIKESAWAGVVSVFIIIGVLSLIFHYPLYLETNHPLRTGILCVAALFTCCAMLSDVFVEMLTGNIFSPGAYLIFLIPVSILAFIVWMAVISLS